MKKLFVLLLLCFCLIGIGFAQNTSVIDPELYALMNSKSGEKISINIILKKQIDANKLNLRKSYSSKTAMRNSMVEELKYQAEKSQADIVKTLTASERSAQVTDVKTHWLTNMINCNATADVIYKIAEHPDVEAVIYNKMENLLFDEKETQGTPTRAYNGTNVEKINAHKVWEMGYTGEGIIVAVIDTGVNADHVDLKDHLWDDGNGNHGWNTVEDNSDITDRDGHGTHCAGTVCGDGTSGEAIGMAPDAKLMTIKALDDNGNATLESLVAGIEWAANKGADILSMSVGFIKPSDYVSEVLRNTLSNTLSMGIVATASAGNVGGQQTSYPIPKNITSPANCPPPWIHPDQQSNEGGRSSVICVGAVNYQDESCNFSSEGPVTWQNTSYGDYGYGDTYPTNKLRYDNSDYAYSWSRETASVFGVMFPSSMLTEFTNGGIVTSVSIYCNTYDNGYVYIYNGGDTPDKGELMHSQSYSYTYSSAGDMYDIPLNKEVQIDVNKNLWVIFDSWSADNSPIPVAKNTDNPNGRWVNINGTWTNNSQITEMIKIHVNISTSNEVGENKIGLIRPDVCAPGYDILSTAINSIASSGNTNYIGEGDNQYYTWKSGTSQAAPCVAGAIALLLQAKPSLTPAQICEVLETTAVKLSDTKSNRTGTGRIDVYEALLALSDTELVAPTLTATAASSSAINLSWTKSSSATYTVYRDGTSIATVSGTSYTDTGLNPDTQYCYQVKAVKGSESKTSNEVCARTYEEGAGSSGEQYRIKVSKSSHSQYNKYLYVSSYTLPSDNIPTLLVGNYAESNNQIFTLEDAGNGNYYLRTADGYYVKCGTTSIGNYWNTYAYSMTEKTPLILQYPDNDNVNFYIRDYDKTTGAGHSLAMPNNNYFKVENGKIYCDAQSNASDVVTWVLEPVASSEPEVPTAPSTPTNLAATAQGTTSIALTWDAVNGATSYNIYDNEDNLVASTENNAYTITELTPATNYCYTVKAVNAIGASESSDKVCAETPAEDTTFEGTITIGTTNDSQSLPVYSNYEYGYSQQIYTKAEVDPNGTATGSDITKILFTQQNSVNNHTRNVTIYMKNTSRTSFANDSDWETVTSADKVFEGSMSLQGTNTNIEITLNTPFKYTGENVLIAFMDNTGGWTSTALFYTYDSGSNRSIKVWRDKNPYDISGMSSVSGYRYGYNNYIELTFVAGSSDPETPAVPNAPTNLVATAQGTTSISLTWNAVMGATSYNVYRDYEYVTNISATSFTDEGLNPSTEYVYTVKAVNSAGDSAASNEARATTDADNTGGDGGGDSDVCTIVIEMYDSWGDGWNGDCLGYSLNGSEEEALEFTSGSSKTYTLEVAKGTRLVINYHGSNMHAENSLTISYQDGDLLYTSDSPYNAKIVDVTVDCGGGGTPTPELPNAPTNLTATAQSSSSIALSWDAVDGVDGYNVYRGSLKIATSITATTFTETGLESSTTYCYTVKSVKDGVESVASNKECAETEPEAPSAPTNLYASAQSATSIGLIWSSVYGAESYKVYRDSQEIATNVTGTSYTDNGLTANTYYCYTVKAVNSAGESEESSSACAMTYSLIPSTPTGLDVTAQSSSSIALTWNSVDGAESYKVYRDSQEIATNVTGTSYTDNGLTANTNYCYTVKAVNSAGESEESGSACAMTYPLAPTGLVATAESTTSIALTWNAVDGAISYNIYRNSTQIATGITVASYTDNGLTPSTEYVYTVKAVNVAGESDASNEVRATTEAIVVEGIEQVVSIGNISNMTSTYLPFETYYTYSYSQQIYTKTEIESNGLMSGGTITKIAFKQKSNTIATRKLKVYMQNVSTSSFGTDKAWVNVTDATKVFDGEVALTGAGDLVITLSLPLEYTGGNLLISVLDYTGTATSNTEFYTYGVSNRSIRFHNYGATMNPSSMSSVYGTRDGVNNVIDITFVMPILEFVGDGDWSNASNWENGVVPNSNSNVAVSGNATINSDVVVRTITIENGGSVTLESGSLTVKDDFTNTDASAFLIEDGTQVFQTNDDVKATFLMNILAPESWAENHTQGWQFIASPMKESMTSAFETEGIDYDLFKYVGGMDEEWVNYKGHNGIDFEETFKQGRGYIVSYETEAKVEFEGTLNHEASFSFPEMSFNEEDHFANFYLLGNPFVFNINWNDVSANDLANGYAVVTFDGNYEYAIDGDINVGDGFFVQTIGAEPSLSYGVNTRGGNNKKNKKNNFINIIATGRDGSDNVIINLTNDDKAGFAKLENFNQAIAEIYLIENDMNYAILNYDEDVDEINLYFDAKRIGEYTINATSNVEFANMTLVDSFTGIETDLLTSSYTFYSKANENQDRFLIRMSRKAESENFVYQSGNELVINAEGAVQIIDVMGRIVYNDNVISNHRIDLSNYGNAAYIVRVVNANEVKTQKVVVY